MSFSFQEIALNFAKKQAHMVDAVTRNTPFLNIIPMEQTTHELWNIAESLTEVTGAGYTDFDGVLQTMSADGKLNQTDLKILGGIIKVNETKAVTYGGKEVYFAKKMPALLRTSGQTAEASILTDIRNYAIANSNYSKTAATSGTGSTILAVTFSEGEINGLYPGSWSLNGGIFDIMNLYNGALGEDYSTGKLVYAQRIMAYFAMQLLNPRKVSALVNIQSTKLPTAALLDDILLKAEAGTGLQTVLVMHPQTYNYVKTLVTSLESQSNANSIFNNFTNIGGYPVITTYQMANGTETFVS